MKQLLFGAALAVLFLSCTNDEEQIGKQQTQDVRFGWQIVTEGVMTRAVQTTDAVAHLRTLMPTDADLRGLKMREVETDQDVTFNIGETYRLRTGVYTIDWQYIRNVFKYDDLHVCGFPTIRIQHQFEIVNGQTEYQLPARYECCAVVWDNSEAVLTINTHELTANVASQTGDTKAVFLSDIDAEQTYTFTLTPVDTETYRTTTWQVTGAQLTSGHYYVLNCNSKYQQAGMLFDLADMEQGTL